MLATILTIFAIYEGIDFVKQLFSDNGKAPLAIFDVLEIGMCAFAISHGGILAFVIGIIVAALFLLIIAGGFLQMIMGKFTGLLKFLGFIPMFVLLIIGLVQHWGTI
jgi:hypothetical protein